MSRCIRCGRDTWPRNGRICHACMKKWREKRESAFSQAVAEIGPLTAETHAHIVKRIKELEKGKP